MKEIPSRIRAVTTDRVVAILANFGEMVLQVEMVFAHDLDADRLARALELLYDAEPVLGCRFVEHAVKPYWERLHGRLNTHLTVAVNETEYAAFKQERLDMLNGPQVRACIWKAQGANRLLVQISHHAADAGGCKHTCAVFSRLYRQLGREPGFVPLPNVAGSRSSRQVLRRLPLRAFPRIYMNYLRETRSNVVPPTDA